MRRLLAAVLLSMYLSAASAAAEQQPTMSVEEMVAVSQIKEAADLLFEHDRAAWITTDAMLASPKVDASKVAGWVTEPLDQGRFRVTFVTGAGKDAMAYVRVTTKRKNRKVDALEVLDPPEALSAYEQAALAARDLASKQEFPRCTERMNSVVYPAGDDLDKWVVYLLSSSTDAAEIPVGGSYRFTVNLSDQSVSRRDYTKSCLTLKRDGERESKGDTAIMFVTHLLDPMPTALHLFLSRTHNTAIAVGIAKSRDIWLVKPDDLYLVERGNAPNAE